MQRLYFLSPDKETTSTIADELNRMGITQDDLHVVGKDWKPLEREGIPVATLRETSDVVKASRRGVVIGAVLGAVLGVVAHLVLDTGLLITLLGLTLFGGLFGLWSSSMVGVAVRDVKISKYKQSLERGAMLMIVDVPAEREDEFKQTVRRHHPEVVIDKVTPHDRQQNRGEGQ